MKFPRKIKFGRCKIYISRPFHESDRTIIALSYNLDTDWFIQELADLPHEESSIRDIHIKIEHLKGKIRAFFDEHEIVWTDQ